MGPLAPFTPYIIQGGASLLGGLLGKKSQSAAQKRSPEEQASLTGAQGAAGNLASTGASMTETGQATQRPATSYYDTLLRGNRAQMAQATAAPRAAITDIYRGAERGVERSGVQGAAKDVQTGELNRQRASQLSSLVTGVQPAAAEALTGIGQQQTTTGVGASGTAGSIYSDLLGQGAGNRRYARAEGEKAGQGIGGLLFDVASGVFKKKPGLGKAPLPSRQTVPNVSSWLPPG
jgi:hypothetical protein